MSRIVLGCFEVPNWGGLTTATYRLFEMMLDDGLDVCYVNLIRDVDVEPFRRRFGPSFDNPRRLPNVHTCRLEAPLHDSQPGLVALLAALEPACIVGMGDIATYLMKRAAPAVPIVLLTGGCMQVDTRTPFTEQGIPPYGGNGAPTGTCDWKEREAVRMADRILTHSGMMRDVYRHFYPDDAHKVDPRVIWFAEWIHRDAREHAAHALPFDARDVDALFVASTWEREEKNYGLVAEIAARLEGASVHVVGEVPRPIPGVTHHGIVAAREDLFRIMGRAKTVVSPSSFDAAPGILFEASAMECNVVASRNCGNWMLCHEELLAEPYTAEAFAERIRRGRARKLPDHMDRFLESGSYRELTRILARITAGLEVPLPPALPGVVSHQPL